MFKVSKIMGSRFLEITSIKSLYLKKVLLTQILQKALFLFIENHSEIIMIHYQTNKITPAL